MNDWIIYLLLVLWVSVPIVLWCKSETNRKKECLAYGRLYVRKTHRNSGPNPCDRAIDNIESIDIPDSGNSLYVSK